MRQIATALIRFYQVALSPLFPRTCRFYPTCSEYTRLAILEHGWAKGVGLGLWRLARCHPFHPGGYDPVPLNGQAARRGAGGG